MSETHHIWRPETGIEPLPADWAEIAVGELDSIAAIWSEQRERLRGTRQLAEFSDRLSREWAIETGIIENLYDIDRGVTVTLIERGFHAELLGHGATNKPREWVLRLLGDQKDALDGVFDFVARKRDLSTSYIKELHAALVRSQTHTDGLDSLGHEIQIPLLKGDWKTQRNFPTRDGTVYAYCPPEQVASEMDRLVGLHADYARQGVDAAVRSAWLHHRFTQIHPFQDGNGRVARALATLVLVQAGLFPFVVTRDDKADYLGALEAGDKGDLAPLVRLMARLQRTQFRKATAISETMLADVAQGLDLLRHAAERRAGDGFDHARRLRDDVEARLRALVPEVTAALARLEPNANALVASSDEDASRLFRSQIVENATRLGYVADTASHQSWVRLDMAWRRRARLVFAFHGIGARFSGGLVCAPFLEFRDDDDGGSRSTLVSVADEPFVFFRDEADGKVLARFHDWRERVLTIALGELSRNL